MIEIDFAWQDRIARARQLLESRLDEELSLDELAQATAYSVFHFHRLFRAATGETVRQYTRRLRLERAAHRLTVGKEDILPIAIDAGSVQPSANARDASVPTKAW